MRRGVACAVVAGVVAVIALMGCEPTVNIDTANIKVDAPCDSTIIDEIKGATEKARAYLALRGDDDSPTKAGPADDDMPNLACTLSGPPTMLWSREGVTKWKDLCGELFYTVELAGEECVMVSGATVGPCHG